ncbi:MAG TPA: AAA family ATPase, partial [Microlunatus sp.]
MAVARVVISAPRFLDDVAADLTEALRNRGVPVWSPDVDVPLGVSIADATAREIARASALIVLYGQIAMSIRHTPTADSTEVNPKATLPTGDAGDRGLSVAQLSDLAAAGPPTLIIPVQVGPETPTPAAVSAYRRLTLVEVEDLHDVVESISSAVARLAVVEPGDPPPGLVEALRAGRSVLVFGGASPTSETADGGGMAGLARLLLERATRRAAVDERRRASLEVSLRRGDVALVLDTLGAALPAEDIEQVVATAFPGGASVPGYSSLAQLPISAVLSLRLDDVAETLFADRGQAHRLPLLSTQPGLMSGRFSIMAFGRVRGRLLLAVAPRAGGITIFDVAAGEPLIHLDSRVTALSLAFGEQDGEPVLAAGGQDNVVYCWNPSTGERVGPNSTRGHATAVCALAFGTIAGSSVLVSGSIDGDVRIWRGRGHYAWARFAVSGSVRGIQLHRSETDETSAGDTIAVLTDSLLEIAVPIVDSRMLSFARAAPIEVAGGSVAALGSVNGEGVLVAAAQRGISTLRYGIPGPPERTRWSGADGEVQVISVGNDQPGGWAAVLTEAGTVYAVDLTTSEGHALAVPGTTRMLAAAQERLVATVREDGRLDVSALDRGVADLTPTDIETVLEEHGHNEFYVLNLFGSVRRPGTVLLTAGQLAAVHGRDLDFTRFMQSLGGTNTMFFVGATLEEVEEVLTLVAASSEGPEATARHFALVEVSDPSWETRAALLRRRFGVQVIPSVNDAAAEFLDALVEAVERAPQVESTTRLLRRLRLVDVGPFTSLDVDLQPGVNVLLGDNGVGKSTVLRAIAAALAGEASRPWAARLLRAGQKFGSVELDLDTTTVRAQISRSSAGSELSVSPAAPLPLIGWLALGFPATRAFRWSRLDAPSADPRRGRAQETDLLPLVTADPDVRPD